ncbi:MAG: glycosyltransferase [Pseudomonadota bacterium]
MLAFLTCLAWLFLLLFWGGFWRADQRLSNDGRLSATPGVTVLIPARDEADTIGDVVRAHRATAYPGPVKVFVVDDHSEDGTANLARDAGAEVISAKPLPHGWSGKLWALQCGLEHADSHAPEAEYLLLTDADILHEPQTLAKLLAKAQSDSIALVSLMARLDTRGLWGALLIPAFVFFFQKLYPFRWVNRTGFPLAAAAGGCVLLRRDALREIGDFASIRDALIDDCTLAARVKRSGGGNAIWLGLAESEVTSLRDNRSFGSIWAMVRRTAFTQLHHSWILLTIAVLGMCFLYLGPAVSILAGIFSVTPTQIILGIFGYALMCLAYWPTLRLYGFSLGWTVTLPLAAFLYTAMTLASAVSHLQGKGGAWKGRTY